MKKAITLLFVISAASVRAMAGEPSVGVPEISPTTAVGALALLGGSILVLRARLKK